MATAEVVSVKNALQEEEVCKAQETLVTPPPAVIEEEIIKPTDDQAETKEVVEATVEKEIEQSQEIKESESVTHDDVKKEEFSSSKVAPEPIAEPAPDSEENNEKKKEEEEVAAEEPTAVADQAEPKEEEKPETEADNVDKAASSKECSKEFNE